MLGPTTTVNTLFALGAGVVFCMGVATGWYACAARRWGKTRGGTP